MNWKIELYKKENGEVPVKEFLKDLPREHRAKSEKSINILQEFGTKLKEPYVKSIKGQKYNGLWELRIKFASDISRIFYFIAIDNTFVLLHGFIKKTQILPIRELDKAKKYMEDYKRRCK